MWAQSRTSYFSELIFGSHQFHPHPPEAKKLSVLSQPPFPSICLSSWLFQNTCHHINQSTFLTGFKITVFVRQESISDLYRGTFRHEELKLCGKSAAEPEKGPNAALINTCRLITRHSSLEHSVAQCLLLKSFTRFQFWKECSQFSYAPSPLTTHCSSAPVMLFRVTQMAQPSTLKEQIKSLHD